MIAAIVVVYFAVGFVGVLLLGGLLLLRSSHVDVYTEPRSNIVSSRPSGGVGPPQQCHNCGAPDQRNVCRFCKHELYKTQRGLRSLTFARTLSDAEGGSDSIIERDARGRLVGVIPRGESELLDYKRPRAPQRPNPTRVERY